MRQFQKIGLRYYFFFSGIKSVWSCNEKLHLFLVNQVYMRHLPKRTRFFSHLHLWVSQPKCGEIYVHVQTTPTTRATEWFIHFMNATVSYRITVVLSQLSLISKKQKGELSWNRQQELLPFPFSQYTYSLDTFSSNAFRITATYYLVSPASISNQWTFSLKRGILTHVAQARNNLRPSHQQKNKNTQTLNYYPESRFSNV